MILYAVLVGRLYYAGARDGQPVWVDDLGDCLPFDTYGAAEGLRQKWIKTRGKKPHPFTDIVNVVLFPADWLTPA